MVITCLKLMLFFGIISNLFFVDSYANKKNLLPHIFISFWQLFLKTCHQNFEGILEGMQKNFWCLKTGQPLGEHHTEFKSNLIKLDF